MHIHDTKKFSYEVEEATFQERVVARSQDTPVLMDIGADWCAPCNVLAPKLERLAREYDGRFLLAKVDADENMRIAGHHGVRGLPTVIGSRRLTRVARFHRSAPAPFPRPLTVRVIAVHHTER